ncbi:hypothetical protein Y024_4357 [Burkholderia pseudomallei TSV44]|nr:hypothetical protein DO73_4103 [Burkholderia pseudomallei]KGS78912.1 hypothetical protein X947_4472 [Burkholderia pseudomallei MSHR7334]KGX57167.1 hypothetical protein Y024_4357 [Burkholderia pseudomallei TSV44]
MVGGGMDSHLLFVQLLMRQRIENSIMHQVI